MQFSYRHGMVRVRIFGMDPGQLVSFSQLLRNLGFGRIDSNGFKRITTGEVTDFEGYFCEKDTITINQWIHDNGAVEKRVEGDSNE